MPQDFNEEMVCSYFELQGYFVRMNVPYRASAERGDMSDIDIVAVDPKGEREAIACEVKGWHTERFTMSYWKDWPKLLNFAGESASAAVRELLGDRTLRHVLVVPPISEGQRSQIEDHAAARDVDLLEWPKLIGEMISFIDVQRHARNSTDHVLRVLKKYGFVDPSGRRVGAEG